MHTYMEIKINSHINKTQSDKITSDADKTIRKLYRENTNLKIIIMNEILYKHTVNDLYITQTQSYRHKEYGR